MGDVVWEAPHPGFGVGIWAPLLEPLMERPGEWARVRTYRRANPAYQAQKDLTRGANQTSKTMVPPGRWEFKSGKLRPDDGLWAIWARYLGPGEEPT